MEPEVEGQQGISQKKKKLLQDIDRQIEKLQQKEEEMANLQEDQDMAEVADIMEVVAENLKDDVQRSQEIRKMVLRSHL